MTRLAGSVIRRTDDGGYEWRHPDFGVAYYDGDGLLIDAPSPPLEAAERVAGALVIAGPTVELVCCLRSDLVALVAAVGWAVTPEEARTDEALDEPVMFE